MVESASAAITRLLSTRCWTLTSTLFLNPMTSLPHCRVAINSRPSIRRTHTTNYYSMTILVNTSHTCLPFGIASAPAVFQYTMDTILQGVEGAACYINDIIITGKTLVEHVEHLEVVLKCLLRHGVHVKRQKCQFLQPSVTILGHRINARCIQPLNDKLKAIVQAPSPKNVQELRSFLGQINYYGKFIPYAPTILAPLNGSL